MKRFRASLAFLALLASPLAVRAQSVGIGTATPNPAAVLELQSTTQGLLLPRLTLAQRTALTASTTAPPVPGLVVYQTDDTPGLYAYSGTGWVLLHPDHLGNHTATQTLNLNSQRLQGSVGTSLGDSTAQVELTAYVINPSAALSTRSNFSARYTRTLLSGYGKLPDSNTNNDYGLWATAYRSGGWAGFFSAGNPKATVRYVGICQNPGYTGIGSAIRIVDGTQGAGKVLMSDALGYGTWQAPASTSDLTLTVPLKYATNDADKIYFTQAGGANGSKLAHGAGWSLDYYAGPNNGAAGVHRFFTGTASGWQERLRITEGGSVGIGTAAPRGTFDVDGPGNVLLVDDPDNGVAGQSVFLPGHLYLAPYSGTSGTAFVQARVPNPTSSTSIALTLRTTNNGNLVDALRLNANGSAAFQGTVTANGVTLTSDARFKANVRSLPGALASVQRLRGVRY